MIFQFKADPKLDTVDENLGPVIHSYQDRPLGWGDLFTTFAPAILFTMAPLAYGLYRYRYDYLRHGPIAARTWSWPWFALTAVALIPLLPCIVDLPS